MKRLLLILLLPLAVAAQPFTASDIAFIGRPPLVTDWALRVVANGGAMPSQNTIQAMETLRLGCISAGLTNKIYSLCVFVPDSVIASATPLFLHKGYPMWTNNFVIGDLSVNGLKGDGTSKAMDTGCMAKALASGGVSDTSDGSRGLTVIVTESQNATDGVPIGYKDANDVRMLELAVGIGRITSWITMTDGNALYELHTNDVGRVGYISGNTWNDSNTNVSVYVASPLEAHKLIATKTIPSNGGDATATDNTISVFAEKHGTTNRFYSAQRLSLAMVHEGLTAAESETLWSLFLACRQTLGGGTGDPVHNWNTKIVAAGGANISTTTSNATRTFYVGLDTDGTLYSMVMVNTYPPDNLTAVRVPLIVQSGEETWANVNFRATNLTVNGLTGNTTDKYLNTLMNFNTTLVRGFSVTSAGMSQLIYASNNGDGGKVEMGGFGGVNIFAGVQSFRGNLAFYCWGASLVNQNFVTRNTSPLTTNWTGYLSGNRTAANAIRLDRVTSGGGTHEVFTNATGSQTLNKTTITNITAHSTIDAVGVPSQWSDRTVSYLAVHSGLTQTQSSNHWIRVQTLRTDYGGGVP